MCEWLCVVPFGPYWSCTARVRECTAGRVRDVGFTPFIFRCGDAVAMFMFELVSVLKSPNYAGPSAATKQLYVPYAMRKAPPAGWTQLKRPSSDCAVLAALEVTRLAAAMGVV